MAIEAVGVDFSLGLWLALKSKKKRNHKPYGPYRIEIRPNQIKAPTIADSAQGASKNSSLNNQAATHYPATNYSATDNRAAAIACLWSPS